MSSSGPVRTGWNGRSCIKASSAKLFSIWSHSAMMWGSWDVGSMPWWELGSRAVSPGEGRENNPCHEPSDFGGVWQKCTIGENKAQMWGLAIVVVVDCRIGHWVTEFICSCFQTQGCATQRSVGVCTGRSCAAALWREGDNWELQVSARVVPYTTTKYL